MPDEVDIMARRFRFHALRPLFAAFLALALFALGGCGEEIEKQAGGVRFNGPAVLSGALGKELPGDLRFNVYSLNAEGVPDTKLPMGGVTVEFAVVGQPEDSLGASVDEDSRVTDAAGLAVARLTLGDKPGVYRLRATVSDNPDLTATVTVLGGVVVTGAGQDGWIGDDLDQNLTVRLETAPGVSVPEGQGRVRFSVMQSPPGTVVAPHVARTDENGVAAASVKLGEKQGKIDVGITVLDGIPDRPSRLDPIMVGFFAIDGWAVGVSMLGGLALFLFGMRMMSESLQFVAGEKLRDLLNMLTRNRVMAVGAGAVVTALIQSSSACSVMVVGFVNAGLMRLEQAIGVIMGADIGPTSTAQIVACRLSAVALPAVFIGVVLLFVAKRQVTKYYASIIIGFGLLFLGMNIMSQELGQMRDSASLISLFQGLNSGPGPDGFVPVWPFVKAIICGLAVTLVLQSSAATIGLLMTVASAGLIDPYAAFGILLGDNIGTTITAVLASIGTSTAAKRAACFHVTFNVLGVVLMILLNFVQWPGHHGRPIFMELANIFTPGDVFRGGENLTRWLANAHTLFNVSCTLLFLPFVNQFAKFCRFIIKADPKEREDERRVLEPHLLATPSLALQQVWTEVGFMLEKAREAQNEGYRALINAPAPVTEEEAEAAKEWNAMAKEARNLEKETDALKEAITRYMSNISLTTLNENQSEMFPHIVRTVNDAEKVADIGKHLGKLAKRVNKRALKLTDDGTADLNAMLKVVDEILLLAEKTVNVNADGIETSGGGAVLRTKLLTDGKALAKAAKAKASELRKNHERRHEQGLCDIKSGVVFLDVANSLARSAGCAFNIIEAACHIPGRPQGGGKGGGAG